MPNHATSETTSEPTPERPSRTVSRTPVPLGGPTGLARWIPAVALALAVLAVALAAWSLLRPVPAGGTASSTTSAADAKGRACAAYATVSNAVSLQTHGDLGPDPVAQQAVAANARVAMATGSSYLLAQLDPNTPGPVADAVRSFADHLQSIAIFSLNGVSNDDPAQAARLNAAQEDTGKLTELCK